MINTDVTEIKYNGLVLAVIPTSIITRWEEFINTFNDSCSAEAYIIRYLRYSTKITPTTEQDIEEMNHILQQKGYSCCTDYAVFLLMRDVMRSYSICKNCGCFSANAENFCAHYLHSVNPYDDGCSFYLQFRPI